jgi:hypothetical protein
METVYRELTDGRTMKIVSQNNETIGSDVFFDDEPVPDGDYIYKSNTHRLIVENGKIVKRYISENGEWINPDDPTEKKNLLTEEKFDKDVIPTTRIWGIVGSVLVCIGTILSEEGDWFQGLIYLVIGIMSTLGLCILLEGFSTIIKLLRKISDK